MSMIGILHLLSIDNITSSFHNIFLTVLGAVTFLFATENSKPSLAQFVATLGDKEKAEVRYC